MKPTYDPGNSGQAGKSRAGEIAPCVRLKNISVRFNQKEVLDGFSLDVADGEKVVLTGESGMGKSTLLRCVLGLVLPYKGLVLIHNRPLTDKNVWELRTLMAYVPQEPELDQDPVREWLFRPFSYRANIRKKKNIERIPGLFRRFSLQADLLDKEGSELSGGEKQRVTIISALLMDREILLLDEPTSALDEANSIRVAEYIGSLKDKTVLAVSHDPAFIAMADRVVEVWGEKWAQ